MKIFAACLLICLTACGSQAQSATSPHLLVMDGNSFVAGNRASGPAAFLGQQILDRLDPSFGSAYVNNGVGGETTPQMAAKAATVTDPACTSYGAHCIVVAVEVTNDLYDGASADQAYAHLMAYCDARHAADEKVIPTTVLSRSNKGTPATFEAERASINVQIKASNGCGDGVIEWDTDPRVGYDGAEKDRTYFSDDFVHPNDAGYALLATLAAPVVEAAAR